MDKKEIKDLLLSLLEKESSPLQTEKKLEEAGVFYNFRKDFRESILDKIYGVHAAVVREVEFARDLKYVLYRIALPGVAAIVLLIISIILMEGSFSVNSFLGLGDASDESIICLLTGN